MFCGIHMKTFSQEMLQISTFDISLKVIDWIVQLSDHFVQYVITAFVMVHFVMAMAHIVMLLTVIIS